MTRKFYNYQGDELNIKSYLNTPRGKPRIYDELKNGQTLKDLEEELRDEWFNYYSFLKTFNALYEPFNASEKDYIEFILSPTIQYAGEVGDLSMVEEVYKFINNYEAYSIKILGSLGQDWFYVHQAKTRDEAISFIESKKSSDPTLELVIHEIK